MNLRYVYTVLSVEIDDHGIHWVNSVNYEFVNTYHISCFPFKKRLSENKYLIIRKEKVITT